jgi:hypothetical protein
MTSIVKGRPKVPWRIIGWGGAAAQLLVPLIAKAPWSLSDYIFAAVAIVGGTFELAMEEERQRMVPRRSRGSTADGVPARVDQWRRRDHRK